MGQLVCDPFFGYFLRVNANLCIIDPFIQFVFALAIIFKDEENCSFGDFLNHNMLLKVSLISLVIFRVLANKIIYK